MSPPQYSTTRFSLIIPAHNEEAYLPDLLISVEKARNRYVGGRDEIEMIVVDNASTDSTADLAQAMGCRVIQEDKRIIAAVRNAGAKSAVGQIFVFVDADIIIHPDTFNVIDRCFFTGKVIAGASGVRLERMSFGIAVTHVLIIPMVWITGMDTGVVFCRQKDFKAIGGYNEDRLFAEDVQFLWDLKVLGRKQGQRLTRMRSVKAGCSTRKFDEWGDWHYLWLMFLFLYGQLFSKRFLNHFARTYWYGKQRTRPHRNGVIE